MSPTRRGRRAGGGLSRVARPFTSNPTLAPRPAVPDLPPGHAADPDLRQLRLRITSTVLRRSRSKIGGRSSRSVHTMRPSVHGSRDATSAGPGQTCPRRLLSPQSLHSFSCAFQKTVACICRVAGVRWLNGSACPLTRKYPAPGKLVRSPATCTTSAYLVTLHDGPRKRRVATRARH